MAYKLNKPQILAKQKQVNMLTIASDPKNVASVEPFVEKVFKRYQINPDMYGNILITLTEAVTNAIIHGNDRDQSKKVKVQLRKLQNTLTFLISDEGPGFDFEDLPDPTAPENLMKVGGRGVFLMRQLCDQVEYHNNGSTVEIHFNI
ncbi:MAG: ATP-binding protein [Bacteroidota bacterium]